MPSRSFCNFSSPSPAPHTGQTALFIFCCSSKVEIQITTGVNKQVPSYSIINRIVQVSSGASLEIWLNVFSPKQRAQRYHFPILYVLEFCPGNSVSNSFIRKLKNLDFLQICLCCYKGNSCNAESITAGSRYVTEKFQLRYFCPFKEVIQHA